MRISDWSSDVCSSDLPALREQTSAIAPSCGDAFAIGLASHDCGQFIALPNRPALRAAVRAQFGNATPVAGCLDAIDSGAATWNTPSIVGASAMPCACNQPPTAINLR